MPFSDIDRNANILRNVVDFSTKNNFFMLNGINRVIAAALDESECRGEVDQRPNIREGMELLKRYYTLNNIDISYAIILAARGYKFRTSLNKPYFCEENANNPNFEKLESAKPILSRSDDIKNAILMGILDSLDKDDDYIIRALVGSIPEFLEKAEGVRYTGRFLSISEWLKLKEEEGEWTENNQEGLLKLEKYGIMPFFVANLIILQIRGHYLQEIPSVAGSSYIFVTKEHPSF